MLIPKENQIVSIYALINPIDNAVFYIGCTHIPWERLNQHISESKVTDSYKSNIIREIKSTGHDVEMLVLDKCHVSEASFWEEFYMDLYKSYGFTLNQMPVSNYTDHHQHRKFLYKTDTRLTISQEITHFIKELAYNLGVGHDFLLKCAVKEFVDKYSDKINAPLEEGQSQKDLQLKVSKEIIKAHPYFDPTVNRKVLKEWREKNPWAYNNVYWDIPK